MVSLCVGATLLCPVALFAQGAQKKLSVGLVLINLQAKFFNDINAGAADAAQKAGVNLQVIDGNNDPTAQVNAVETLTQQKVDGIIMVAIDVKEAIEVRGPEDALDGRRELAEAEPAARRVARSTPRAASWAGRCTPPRARGHRGAPDSCRRRARCGGWGAPS